jgi:hypothetical protein
MNTIIITVIIVVIIVVIIIMNKTEKYNEIKTRPMIVYHHVHKSGGTSFIKLGKMNGEILYFKNKNGLPVDEKEKFIKINNDVEFDKYLEESKKKGVTFVTTEFYFPKINRKKFNVLSIIILRNPIDRIISHIAHILREREEMRYMGEEWKINNDGSVDLGVVKKNIEVFSNLLTKSLAHKPYIYDKKITDEEFEEARKNLESFDEVLILENTSTYLKMQKYGWTNFNIPHENVSYIRDKEENTIDTTKTTREILKILYGTNYIETLKNLNKQDIKLYNLGLNRSLKNL